MGPPSRKTREQAAEILDRIAVSLPMPASVAGYLHGYAAALRSLQGGLGRQPPG